MTTAARVFTEGNAHWYYPNGEPCYELPKKDGGVKSPTLADAKKLGLKPGVTKIIGLLDKPALNDWKVEQACLAILTSTQKPEEALDAFVHRVLHEERVQDEEAKKARDVGTQIHDAIDKAINGEPYDTSLEAFVKPVLDWRTATGRVVWTEKHLIGDGYGGRGDVLLENETLNYLLLVDFKTTSKLPEKASWLEHRLQTAAYAATVGNTGDRRIITGNVYISTKKPGDIAVFTQDDWQQTYACGFLPLLEFWQWSTGHYTRRKE